MIYADFGKNKYLKQVPIMVRVNIRLEDMRDTHQKSERSNVHVAINHLPVQSKAELLCRLIAGMEMTAALRDDLSHVLERDQSDI